MICAQTDFVEMRSLNIVNTCGVCHTLCRTSLFLALVLAFFTYEKRRGREWSRREPSDIDEARKGKLSGESESIEPARGVKPRCSTKRANFEAGAGIEPANSGFADRDLTTWLPRQLRERTMSVRREQKVSTRRDDFYKRRM